MIQNQPELGTCPTCGSLHRYVRGTCVYTAIPGVRPPLPSLCGDSWHSEPLAPAKPESAIPEQEGQTAEHFNAQEWLNERRNEYASVLDYHLDFQQVLQLIEAYAASQVSGLREELKRMRAALEHRNRAVTP